MQPNGANDIRLLPGFADYPLDQWYVAAFSDEVVEGKIFGRMICDEPIALYRKKDGSPVALFDRCPHRGLPFSAGHVVGGERVQCGYHGFEFDETGRCVRIPAQETVPDQMRVRSYPVVERWQWIWVWPGDPDKADPALLPDHEALGLTRAGWGAGSGIVLHAKANYLLLIENLIDATHIAYLHSNPHFGADQHMDDQGSALRAPFSLEVEGNVVRMERRFDNEVPGAGGIQVASEMQSRDRVLVVEAHAPQTCVVGSKWRPSGSDQDYLEAKLVVMISPETRRTSWKFTAGSANTRERLFDDSDDALHALFKQDITALELIQARSEELGPDRCAETSQRADVGGMRLRQRIMQSIKAERHVAVAAE